MESWVLLALCAACLYAAMSVIACLSAGRRADDKLEEFGAELRLMPLGSGPRYRTSQAADRRVSEPCSR